MLSKENFANPENQTRLRTLINIKMNLPYNTLFSKLSKTKQRQYNKLLNEYIVYLGEDWESILERDFNEAVCDEILNEQFVASNEATPALERELLVSEEQKVWFEKLPEDEKSWFNRI
jgi:hypothetical protein